MARLTLSIFTLDQSHPVLLTGKGKELFFRLLGADPIDHEREIYAADLEDGTYYLCTNDCDDETGKPETNILERVTVEGGQVRREELGRVSKSRKLGEELDLLSVEWEGVPQQATDLLFAPVPQHFATW